MCFEYNISPFLKHYILVGFNQSFTPKKCRSTHVVVEFYSNAIQKGLNDTSHTTVGIGLVASFAIRHKTLRHDNPVLDGSAFNECCIANFFSEIAIGHIIQCRPNRYIAYSENLA